MVRHRFKKGSSRTESRNNTSSTSHSGSEHRVSTTSSSNSRSVRSRHDTSTSDRSRSNAQRSRAGGVSSESSTPFVHVPISSRRHRSERTGNGTSVASHRSSSSSSPLDSPLTTRASSSAMKNGRPSPPSRQPPLPVKLRIGTSSSATPASPTPPRLPVPPSNDDDEEEDPCPICLDKRTDEAAILYCMHRYCFQCIKRWAEGSNNTCPLCKMIFSEIAFNIQSDSSYDVYKIKQRRLMLPNRNLMLSHLEHADVARPHSTRLGLGIPSRGRPEEAHVQLQLQRQLLALAMNGMRGEAVGSVRLVLYQTDRRTLVPPQYSYCPTPEDFSSNETLIHRVVPFLVRDLVVVFAIAEPVRDWIVSDIQVLLRTYHVESEGFELQVRSIFTERVGQPVVYPRHYIDILIDELRAFVLYNHELEDFDRLSSSSMHPRVRRRDERERERLETFMRYNASDDHHTYLAFREQYISGSALQPGARHAELALRRGPPRSSRLYGAGGPSLLGHSYRGPHYSNGSGELSSSTATRLTLAPPSTSNGNAQRPTARWQEPYLSLLDFVSSSDSATAPPPASSAERATRAEEPPQQRSEPSTAPRVAPLNAALNSLSVGPVRTFSCFPSGDRSLAVEPLNQAALNPSLDSSRRSSSWQPLTCPWSPTPLYGHGARPARPTGAEEGGASSGNSREAPRPTSPDGRSSLRSNGYFTGQADRSFSDLNPTTSSPLGVSVGYGLDLPSPPIEPSTSSAAAAAPPLPASSSGASGSSLGDLVTSVPVPVIEISSEEEGEERDFRPRPSRGDEDCVILSQSVALSSEDEAAQQPRPSSSREADAVDNGSVGATTSGGAAADDSNPWRPWQGRRRHQRDPTVSELIAYKKQRASSASDTSDDSSTESSSSSDSSLTTVVARRLSPGIRQHHDCGLEWGSSVYFHSHQSRVDERRRRRMLRRRQRMSCDARCSPRRHQKPSPPPLCALNTAPDTSNSAGSGEVASTSAVKRSASPPVPLVGEPDSSAAPLRPPKCPCSGSGDGGGGPDESLMNGGGQSPQLLNAAEVGRVFADLELEIGAASTTSPVAAAAAAAAVAAAAAAAAAADVRRASSSSTYAYPIELDAMLAAVTAPEPESSSTGDVRLEEPTVSEAPPAVLLEPPATTKREPRPPSPSSTSPGGSPAKRAALAGPVRPRPRIPKLGFTFINLTGEDATGSSGAAVEVRKGCGSNSLVMAAFKRRVRAQSGLAGISDAVVLEKLSSIARPARSALRREFPRWRERPEASDAVVDLVASDNEEGPAPPQQQQQQQQQQPAATVAKVAKKEKTEAPVRRKMRAGFDAAWPPSPPSAAAVVDLVDEDEPAEAEAGGGSVSDKEGSRSKGAGNMRALEFVYPRTTAEFYRSLRGETVVPATTTAAAAKASDGEVTGTPRKKLRLAAAAESAPAVSDADKLSSIVEEMEIGEHRVVGGKEKAAMHGDKAEVEAMEVDYIPELETLRKEMIRLDRELLVPAPPTTTASEVESMEVETTTPLDAAPAAEAVAKRAEAAETKAPPEAAGGRKGQSPVRPVMAGLEKKGDAATSSVNELTGSKASRPEQGPEAPTCSSSTSSSSSSSTSSSGATAQPPTTVLPQRRRRWRSLSDVCSPAVRDARIGTSPEALKAEAAAENGAPACRCFADRETMTRCTQTDRSFCLVSFLPTSCAPGLSSAFISSTTASSLGVALNLAALPPLSPKPLATTGAAGGKGSPARRAAKRSVSESAAMDGEANAVKVGEPGVLRRASSLALLG